MNDNKENQAEVFDQRKITEKLNKVDSQKLAKPGKYLTFSIGNEEYGVEILKVMEIIGIMDITAIPHVPKYVKGVINLRGKVIPVISLRLKFGMKEIPFDSETCIINVNLNNILIGILIDRVLEVLDITKEDIEPSPCSEVVGKTDFILGMGKVGDKVKILLNIDNILTDDLSSLERVCKK
ncbi:purine-binding chemotaxis protein CheW [bacterium]|nr:purine-binding chemotaxis protein CheW [bacterium]